jgi:hypothetical protein
MMTMYILDCTWFLKLVVKGGRISLENGVTSGFNRIGVQGGIVTSHALALWATRCGRRKTLAVKLQTTANIVYRNIREREKHGVS